jgi:hypothetical protein
MPIDVDNLWLFRIVHINNVEHILRNGIVAPNSELADTDYLNIGDSTLIGQRSDYPVKIEGYGNLGDFVPFYFGPLSPMLLNIKTGHRGISQTHQSEIVYICCRFNSIVINCNQWCFTDGHAKAVITEFFNHAEDLDHVDWEIVGKRYWNNTEEDFDRMRRKQAEFLVRDYVPVQCIEYIIVFNEEMRQIVRDIVNLSGLNIPVSVNPENNYYY